MNMFQNEVINRTRRTLKIVGLGTLSSRAFVGFVRSKLKKDIKNNKCKFKNKKK